MEEFTERVNEYLEKEPFCHPNALTRMGGYKRVSIPTFTLTRMIGCKRVSILTFTLTHIEGYKLVIILNADTVIHVGGYTVNLSPHLSFSVPV